MQSYNSDYIAMMMLFCTLLALKLTNVIDWSWWWITAPMWGSALLLAVKEVLCDE